MFLSKKMAKPAGLAVELDLRGKPKKPPAHALGAMHDDMSNADDDESGLHDGDIMPSRKGSKDPADNTSSGMQSLYGSDHDGDDDDDSADDANGDADSSDEAGDDGDHDEISLADATEEELEAALAKKRAEKSKGSSDEDEMGDESGHGGGDGAGDGDYI